DGYSADLSPDGRSLVFVRKRSSTQSDLLVLPAMASSSTTETPRTILGGPSNTSLPRFSPDGRLISYVDVDKDMFNVYVRRFPAGEEQWQASFEGGRF